MKHSARGWAAARICRSTTPATVTSISGGDSRPVRGDRRLAHGTTVTSIDECASPIASLLTSNWTEYVPGASKVCVTA